MVKRFHVKYKGKSARGGKPIEGALIVSTCAENPSRMYIERRAKESIGENEPDVRNVKIMSMKELG